ncbi:MAG TPA: recombinase family protein [Candidatus Omnitrophota bacterium]|nr:recombinase family protein [Candidatus Omnitrophota bacterium]HQO57381.1 recombinase family protein [Candidatus Omnitrophota bacterium]
MKRAGVYARVSTGDQSSIQQIEKLREYCSNAGYQIFSEYIDEGESALKQNRPAYIRLLEDARKRKINVIVVYKLDRFSRSLKELVNTIDLLKEYGVNFISYSEKDFDTTTATGQLMFHVVSAFAQFERDIISERTKLKLQHLKRKGIKLGRPRKASFDDVVKLRDEGLSLNQIGREIGCDKSTVSKLLKNGGYGVFQPKTAGV